MFRHHGCVSSVRHYAWVVLGLIILAVFGSLGLARFGYTSVLPAMQHSLALSNTQTGELQSWNLLGYLLTVVFAGVLASRFGPRRVIAVALAITGMAMIVTGAYPTFTGARWGRFWAGVGGAGANVPAMALVSAWFGARRRGMATGLGVAGSSVGLMLAGPLVPALLRHHGPDGWRVTWHVFGALTLGIAVLCACFLRNRPSEKGLRPLGETDEPLGAASGPPGDPPAASAVRSASSALQWSLVYRSRLLWHLALVYFGFGFSYIIYSTFFIRHLVKEGGLTPEAAGVLWMNIGTLSGISGFLWGGVSDRWGRRFALMGVFLVQGTSFLALGFSHALGVIYFSATLFGLTAWSIPALMAALAGDIFGARLAPAALGLVTVVFGLGQALGPTAAGAIADATRSFAPALVLAGGVALVLGAGGAWTLPRPR